MNASGITHQICLLQNSGSSSSDSPFLKQLEANSTRDFTCLLIFSALVAIGIFFEWPEAKEEFRKWWRTRPSKTKWLLGPRPERSHVPLWSLVGFILVVIGVGGEGVFEGMVGCDDSRLRQFDNGVAIKAGTAAKAAEVAADGAVADFKQVDGRIKTLNEGLDRASSQLSGIKEAVRSQGPRWKLLEDNKAEFVKALKPFPRQKVIVMFCGEPTNLTGESFGLWEDLLSFLGPDDSGGAGWKTDVRMWETCQKEGALSLTGGNWIITSWTSKVAVGDAAKALNDILNRIGIVTERAVVDARMADRSPKPDSVWGEALKDPTSVVILIGEHPQIISQRKLQKK